MRQEAQVPTGKTQCEIPYSLVEYTAVFKKPILGAWTIPANFVAAILDALAPFGFTMDGVEVKIHTEKLSDYAFVFRRTPPGVTFTLGVGKLVITAENLDWTNAEQFILGARAGIDVVLRETKAEFKSQQLTVALHIQLKDRPRQEVTAPLLSPAALKLMDGEIKLPGIILIRDKATLIVDGSVPYANALFVRIIREHAGDAGLEQMSAALRADEEQLFGALGLEGAL